MQCALTGREVVFAHDGLCALSPKAEHTMAMFVRTASSSLAIAAKVPQAIAFCKNAWAALSSPWSIVVKSMPESIMFNAMHGESRPMTGSFFNSRARTASGRC